MLSPSEQQVALDIAWRAVVEPLRTGARWLPDPLDLSGELAQPGACFVTLRARGALLGCIGSLVAYRLLGVDVASNAAAAAYDDPRLPAVTEADLPLLDVHVSVLGPLAPATVTGRTDIEARLRPMVDGLVVEASGRRATFLPSVWEQLPDPTDFVDALWVKAGWRVRDWPDGLQVSTYEVQEFGTPAHDP
jgi:AmmeMemoRadiSam system protein A